MQKRKHVSEGASVDSSNRPKRHNYSQESKEICLSLMLGEGHSPISATTLANYQGLPNARTLRRWKHDVLSPPTAIHPAKKRGRPSVLTSRELDILGGFVLFCAEHHQTCGISEIQAFVEDVFDVKVAPTYVSRHMKELGFTTHRAASMRYTYGGKESVSSAVQFLEEVQPVLRDVPTRESVVAIDQISFWDCGIIQSTYAPIGGYCWHCI